jgi:predicted nucleic acid-binding protein
MKIVLDTNVLVAGLLLPSSGKATCLVMGDKAHFPSKLCQGINVLAPG